MLRFVNEFIDLPVLSLRGGRRISTTLEAIIDPRKLRVVGFYADDRASGIDKILLVEDIRELTEMGIIVDSEDSLTDPSDLVRLEEVLNMQYEIVNKKLVTQSGQKIGKADDFAVDDTTFKIEKIYGRPVAMKALKDDFIISRRQIASVSMEDITVKDAFVRDQKRHSKRQSFSPQGS